MDSTVLKGRQNEKETKIQYIMISVLIMLLALASVTNGSLWFDEACRVFDPISGDIAATMQTALGYAQPGYFLYMFVWTRFAGGTEFALRCSNLPWVLLAIVYVFKILRARNWSPWWALVFFLHPMFVYYMDEATPYIVLYSISIAFLYHTWFTDDFDSVKNTVCINVFYLLGVFVHFIFGFIIMLYFTKCVTRFAGRAKTLVRHALVMLCFAPAYVILLYLYIINLMSSGGRNFGIKNLAYIPYSFLGMQGLGLSRNDLRAGNFNKITTWQIALLVMFVVVWLCLFVLVLRDRKAVNQFLKQDGGLLIAVGLYFLAIIVASAIVGMNLWDRHCIPALAVYFLCLLDLWHLVFPKTALFRAAAVGYVALLIISCANIRLNYYYACDDEKGMNEAVAAWLAEDAEHVVVAAQRVTRFAYYSYEGAAVDPERQIIDVYQQPQEEIVECFEALPPDDVMLILGEKDCSRQLYYYYDDREGFDVNARYNSFKLIMPVA